MVTQISYIILFGVLATSRATTFRSSDTNHDEFLKRLEEFYKQGKYEIAVSHHEDSPKSHHLDQYRISYKDKPLSANNNQREEAPSNTVESNLLHRSAPKLSNFKGFLDAARQKENDNNANNATCMQKWAQCSQVVWKVGRMIEKENPTTVGEVLDFLIEYEKILEDNGVLSQKKFRADDLPNIILDKPRDENNRMKINNKYLLRCKGNGCSVINEAQDDDDDDDDRNDGHYLRNAVNKYGRNREDRDYDRNNLRCVGNRCGRNRGDRDDDNDRYNRGYLRCVGNRCERNREDRDDDDDDDDRYQGNKLRCVGNRCGRNRGNRDDDDDDGNEEYVLRCVGNRCNRERDDREYERNDRVELRCVGDRCERTRDDKDDRDDNDRDNRGDYHCRGYNCARSDDEDENNNGLEATKLELPYMMNSLLNLSQRSNGNSESAKDSKYEENAQIQRLLKDREQLIKKLKNLMTGH